MRFVVDNNQLSDIRKTAGLSSAEKRRITLVLPALVWAEAARYGRDNQRCLLDYNVRFGRDVADVLRDAAEVTDAQLRNVESLVKRRSPLHLTCLSDLAACPPWRAERADQIKKENLADMNRINDAIRKAQDKDHAARSRGEEPQLLKHVASLDDYIAVLKPLLQKIPFHNPGDDPAPARTYWELLMSGNVRLVNFVRFHLVITYAKTGAWEDELHVRGPTGNRDDIPDMTLPLYADPGDIIVTGENDKKFRGLFRMVEPTRRIRVRTWDECLERVL